MIHRKSRFAIGACLLLVMLVSSAVAMAVQQNGLTVTQDTVLVNAVDTASSATSNTPSKPSKPSKPSSSSPSTSSSSPAITYAVSKEEAIKLAMANLNADDTWSLTYGKLSTDGGSAAYFIVLTDPVGDAHLRLVDANTGAVTVQSLWEYFSGGESSNSGSYSNDDQTDTQDEEDRDRRENENDEDDDDDDREGDSEARLNLLWMSALQEGSGARTFSILS